MCLLHLLGLFSSASFLIFCPVVLPIVEWGIELSKYYCRTIYYSLQFFFYVFSWSVIYCVNVYNFYLLAVWKRLLICLLYTFKIYLSNISIASPDPYSLLFACSSFSHPFTLNPFVCILRAYCRQLCYWTMFIHSAKIFWLQNSFTFKLTTFRI